MADRLPPGFPLYDNAEDDATKADLFFVASALYRICLVQSSALTALKDGQSDQFESALVDADRMLNGLYTMLQTPGDDE